MPATHPARRPQRRARPWTRIATAVRRPVVRRNQRGEVYSSVIMVAVGVVIAITVGGILFEKFTDKANEIDTDTPAVTIPRY